MKTALSLLFPFALIVAPASQAASAPRAVATAASDTATIERGIQTYLRSIDQADTTLGATIFATSSDTFFIHPRGTERGWNAVAANFYGKTMGETFSLRSLKLTGAPHVHVYGAAAVVDFEWDFNATRRDNGQPLHTTGRESQTWAKLPRQGWRIVAVHYSGPPKTGNGQGF